MSKLSPGVVFASVAAVVLVVVAIARVYPHVRVVERTGDSGQVDRIEKVVVHADVPDLEVVSDSVEIEQLRAGITRRVRDAWGRLSDVHRLGGGEIDRLSDAMARYVLSHRYSTREEYLEHYPFDAPGDLADDKGENADRAWAYQTEWARYDSVRAETIDVRPFYIRGQRVSEREDVAAVSRRLSDGTSLLSSGAGDWSVYVVSIDVSVPSFDRRVELDVRLDIFFANDAPDGEWSAVVCQYVGAPNGVFLYIPRP